MFLHHLLSPHIISTLLPFLLLIITTTAFSDLPVGFHFDLDEVSLSAGHYHTCAIELRPSIPFGGALKCWGKNENYQCNPPSGTFVQVSCGHIHTCAISIDETVHCWGELTGKPPPKGLFTQVSSGEHHACGLSKDGSIVCWGRNYMNEGNSPSGDFVQVSSGNGHTCGLRKNGRVECWGSNQRKQNLVPEAQFKQISASLNHHVCGLKMDGDIVCWGDNSRGQSEAQTGPFTQVSVGLMSSCGLRHDKSIYCWGVSQAIPHASLKFEYPDDHFYDQVSLGSEHACAVHSSSGEVHCWVRGIDYGQHVVPLGFEVP